MQEKILTLLRKKQEYVSGEEISQNLGISRQALWKYITQLRESGYDILAAPHLGYQLISCPDRLFPSEINQGLNTKIIGKKIYYFDTISSTMDYAMQLGMKNVSEGTVVLSETQSKGRGRLGRSWISPKYKGIYLSLVLRPKIAPSDAPLLTLLTAVSLCEAIRDYTNVFAQIKWPNDILCNDKKVSGILTELSAEMDLVHFVVIGFGINVNSEKKFLVDSATSLFEESSKKISRIKLLQEVLRKIEQNYFLFQKEGSEIILNKWRELSLTLGKRVKVDYHKGVFEGLALDIDADGGLLVRKDSGLVEKVLAADIIHCK